jgi:hypothetical protein
MLEIVLTRTDGGAFRIASLGRPALSRLKFENYF